MNRSLLALLGLFLVPAAFALDVEEFDTSTGEWVFSPQRIGRSTTEGWSRVDDGGDWALRTNPSPTSATYYWTLGRDVDLTGAREPKLAVRWTFHGEGYESAQVQVGPPGSTRSADFSTVLDVRVASSAPTDHVIDLAAWDEQKIALRVQLKKPTGVVTTQSGLTLRKIGVTVEPEPPPPPPPPEIISVGSFNVQAFGLTKMDKAGVPEALVSIADRYDVLLIQEIRDKSGGAIVELLDLINAYTDDDFAMVISDRLGRTVSKEQYAFLYRPSKLSVVTSYHFDDGVEPTGDFFEREPFIVQFASPSTGRDFAVAALHTSPDSTPEELAYLDEVRLDMEARLEEQDLLLMGDFNAGCSYLTPTEMATLPIATDPTITWQIPDASDTTTSTTACPYDRILTTESANDQVVAGSASIYLFDGPLNLSPTLTRQVSDHYPVEMLLDLSLGE